MATTKLRIWTPGIRPGHGPTPTPLRSWKHVLAPSSIPLKLEIELWPLDPDDTTALRLNDRLMLRFYIGPA